MLVKNQITVEFGIIKDFPDAYVDYEGDGETGVKITIDVLDSAGGIRINNTTRSESLILNDDMLYSVLGTGLQKYDTITISTERGNKTAKLLRNGVTYNILNAVDLSSKWIQLQKGTNRLTITADYGMINLKVYVTYNTRVLGV